VSHRPDSHEEQLGALLGELPPAPDAWMAAAQALPAARRAMDDPGWSDTLALEGALAAAVEALRRVGDR
jgi:hypothetical protein